MRKFIFAIAIFCLTYGLYNKEHLTVLHKAVTICLECVGIG